jgi:dTDP-4-dehydrorhamnose reductase
MKKKIIILGSSGQLGSYLKLHIIKKNYKIISLNSSNGDISNFKLIKTIFSNYRPKIIINCAAITNVDLCEKKKKLSYLTNTLSVKHLAQQCKIYGSLLIHFSTDYIFNSRKIISFKENDFAKPINYYGRSKLLSEKEVSKSGCDYLILRISWLYSKSKNNFLNFFLKSLGKKKKFFIVKSYSSPTSVRLVAKILNLFLNKNIITYKNIFHLSCDGTTSWQNIYLHIARVITKGKINIKFEKVKKISTWNAKRPFCSKLSCKKIEKFLSIKLPNWKKELNYYLK